MKKLPTKYDALFQRIVPGTNTQFLRALSYRESRMNPRDVTPKGSSWGHRGLMQVGRENVEDFNKKHGTAWSKTDVFDPEKNIRVFADTLGRIRRVYARTSIPETPEFIVMGWNSGYGAVERIAKWLRAHELRVTRDNVFRYAEKSGERSAALLFSPAKLRWQRSVVALYKDLLGGGTTPPRTTGGRGWLLLLMVLALAKS